MRKYSNYYRILATKAIADKKLFGGDHEFIHPRKSREITLRENGKDIFIVKLQPKGNCTQWEAVFPNGQIIFGGMTKILNEFKRQNPPLLSLSAL